MFRSITDWRRMALQPADTALPGLSRQRLTYASAEGGPVNVVPIRHEAAP